MTKSRNINASRHRWTEAEDAQLRELYPHTKTSKISDTMGLRESQVYQHANALGLKKSPEYLASPDACRLRRGDNIGSKFRFKSGEKVWNKGMKGLDIGGKETRFKAGHMPVNTNAIGSHRITKDGTLQRKIGSASGNNSKRWRGVHELVWIEANGPVPRGHIVVFKAGQRANKLEDITLDRVECISFAENMRRNSVHNLPKELAQLCQLRGALNRQINMRTSK